MQARQRPHRLSPPKVGDPTAQNRIAHYKPKAGGSAAVVAIGERVRPRRIIHAIRMGYGAGVAIDKGLLAVPISWYSCLKGPRPAT